MLQRRLQATCPIVQIFLPIISHKDLDYNAPHRQRKLVQCGAVTRQACPQTIKIGTQQLTCEGFGMPPVS